MAKTLLVSGASGFIASHTIIDLLDAGYQVRGTVRDPRRSDRLREMFQRGSQHAERLELVEANLTDADSWLRAADGCDGIIHVASPAPVVQPKDPDELIVPARAGTLNVLAAARRHKIARVVVTSSVSAVSSGIVHEDNVYTATDWTDLTARNISPYDQSKTLAERAAWDFVREGGPELVTVNPSMVFGPALERDYGSSLEVLVKLLTGAIPLLPRIGIGIVDVRDVASLHRLAFEIPEAAGNRYLCSGGSRWLDEIAELLRREIPDHASRIPRRAMPGFLVRFFALFFKELNSVASEIDKIRIYDCSPALALGWQPRGAEEAIIAGARSLIDLGIV